MSTVTIRPGRVEDAPALRKMEVQNFTDPWSEGGLLTALSNPLSYIRIAESDGRPVGYLIASRVLDEGELLRIAVDPDSRVRGVGKALTETMMRENPENTIENWQKIEKDTLEKKKGFSDGIKEIGAQNGTFSRYVVGFAKDAILEINGKANPKMDIIYNEVSDYKKAHPGVSETDPALKKLTQECRKLYEDKKYADCEMKVRRMNKEQLRKAYEKLTKAVIKQVLSEESEVSGTILTGIAADPVCNERDRKKAENQAAENQIVIHKADQTYSELATKALRTFVRGKALEGDNIGKTLRDLDSGKLKTDLIQEMEKEHLSKRGRIEEADKAAAREAENRRANAQRNIGNHP